MWTLKHEHKAHTNTPLTGHGVGGGMGALSSREVGSHRGHLFALRLCHPPSSANTTYGADSEEDGGGREQDERHEQRK